MPTMPRRSRNSIARRPIDTIGLQWLLVTQSRVSTTTAGDLARIIYENTAALALDDGFASRIEPAAIDKDAFIVAHTRAPPSTSTTKPSRSWTATAT